jgi:peptidoglycan-associated lipoprotein
MKLSRLVLVTLLAVGLSACTCKTRRVGDEGPLPLAAAGSVLKDVNFAFDRYDLDSTARDISQANASWLNENATVNVQIEGHTDERGTNEYNYALGSRRAEAVRDYLQSLGVDAGRMTTISYGEDLPLDPASNETAWAKNRRAHIRILQ